MPTGLGRGLSSLIPQKVKKVTTTAGGEAVVDITSSEERNKVLALSPESIKANPFQPRRNFAESSMEELTESIREYGIIQPLIVSRKGQDYELIAGERRLRAAKILGLKEVPAIVREASEQEKLEVALIENIQREDLNPIETALAYRKLTDEFNLSNEALGRKLGKSRPTIANFLRLLNLPEEIQQALIEGKISAGHALIIAGLDKEEKQFELFKRILHNGLSVGASWKETRVMGGTKQARVKINYGDKDKEFALREFFGSRAEIKRKGRGGEMIIYFFNDEELEGMIEKVRKT